MKDIFSQDRCILFFKLNCVYFLFLFISNWSNVTSLLCVYFYLYLDTIFFVSVTI